MKDYTRLPSYRELQAEKAALAKRAQFSSEVFALPDGTRLNRHGERIVEPTEPPTQQTQPTPKTVRVGALHSRGNLRVGDRVRCTEIGSAYGHLGTVVGFDEEGTLVQFDYFLGNSNRLPVPDASLELFVKPTQQIQGRGNLHIGDRVSCLVGATGKFGTVVGFTDDKTIVRFDFIGGGTLQVPDAWLERVHHLFSGKRPD